ncbi:hypothetical protein [Timonella sp. A28]|uniref:hypothetical protein n=1 Tax=Timonella sp. A28 TaxID=3442640 RepID=UPI003EB90A00
MTTPARIVTSLKKWTRTLFSSTTTIEITCEPAAHAFMQSLSAATLSMEQIGVEPPSKPTQKLTKRPSPMTTPREQLADLIAYQRVKETNPKADHHIFGYHQFSKEQRAFLAARAMPLADAIIKAGWTPPPTPTTNPHLDN